LNSQRAMTDRSRRWVVNVEDGPVLAHTVYRANRKESPCRSTSKATLMPAAARWRRLNIPEYYIPIVESTTVKVSKDTAKKLAVLQHRLRKATLDATIQTLVARHRKDLIEESFGADRGRLSPFSEGDRGEDRS